ncbi:hypothetical protein NT6N_40330 [Oceaniferula spumae]|uniref:Uncharacterized protein n=1 Tax=Oceaniferula spumae TaxID=2979115 RepID=A0AAT9FS62_9BACT
MMNKAVAPLLCGSHRAMSQGMKDKKHPASDYDVRAPGVKMS